MFHDIPETIRVRMQRLEEIDSADRRDGTPQALRLRQIPPQTGRLLAMLLAGAPHGSLLEIGTSAGYSTLWLSLACRATGSRLTTFEVQPEKAKLARQTITECGLENLVHLVEGDARDYVGSYADTAFCFLDAEKDIYAECYELVVPNLVGGGILVADNAISHGDSLRTMLNRALSDQRVDALVIPIGSGLLVCRRI